MYIYVYEVINLRSLCSNLKSISVSSETTLQFITLYQIQFQNQIRATFYVTLSIV